MSQSANASLITPWTIPANVAIAFHPKFEYVAVEVGDAVYIVALELLKATSEKLGWSGTKVIAGFAGSTADAFSLFSRFEAKLEQYHGNIGRGAVELAKDWRTDKFLRHLEALLLVSDKEQTFLLSGQGDVIEPDGGIAAIGSGGPYAQAAAQAIREMAGTLGGGWMRTR